MATTSLHKVILIEMTENFQQLNSFLYEYTTLSNIIFFPNESSVEFFM